MDNIVGAILITVLAVSLVYLFKKPSIALGFLLTMYGTEQLFMRCFPFFGAHQSLYNYLVGIIGITAAITALFRWGKLRANPLLSCLFFSLVFFGWSSLLWTGAPESARISLTHFTLEGSMAIFLPFLILQNPRELRPAFILVITIAFLCSCLLIVSPVPGISGRFLLLNGATPLSPAELLGVSIILLALGDRSVTGPFHRIRIPLLAVLFTGCLLTGVRFQLIAALVTAAAATLALKKQSLSKHATGLLFFTALAGFICYLFSDLVMFSVSKRFNGGNLIAGLNDRLFMISTGSASLFDSLLLGKGVMGWAWDHFHQDIYKYPHNALYQVFYELGISGLLLFISIVITGSVAAVSCFLKAKRLGQYRELTTCLCAYFCYSVMISFKQGTFMSCLGIYIGTSSLTALNLWYRQALNLQKNDESSSVQPIASHWGVHKLNPGLCPQNCIIPFNSEQP